MAAPRIFPVISEDVPDHPLFQFRHERSEHNAFVVQAADQIRFVRAFERRFVNRTDGAALFRALVADVHAAPCAHVRDPSRLL